MYLTKTAGGGVSPVGRRYVVDIGSLWDQWAHVVLKNLMMSDDHWRWISGVVCLNM